MTDEQLTRFIAWGKTIADELAFGCTATVFIIAPVLIALHVWRYFA